MTYAILEVKDLFELSFDEDEVFASGDDAVDVVVGVGVKKTRRSAGTHPQFRLRQPRAESAAQTPRQLHTQPRIGLEVKYS